MRATLTGLLLYVYVGSALARLDPDEANAAVRATRAGLEVHRRSLVDHLSAGGLR